MFMVLVCAQLGELRGRLVRGSKGVKVNETVKV